LNRQEVIMSDENAIRPRWGTFSVVDHRDLVSLVPEILLYDKLVFPVPDEGDWARWKDKRWKPELQKRRLAKLKGLVHGMKWTQGLRDQWSANWERLKAIKGDVDGLALNLTPHVLAMSVLTDRIPPPIVIAAYRNAPKAIRDFGLAEDSGAHRDGREQLHRQVCALFERRLQMPIMDDPEKAFEEAIKLAHNVKFQHARRSLFEWEDRRVTAGWPTDAAIKELDQLIDQHDEFVVKAFKGQTTQRSVFHLVELGSTVAVKAAAKAVAVSQGYGELGGELAGELAGEGIKGTFKWVKARIPSLAAEPGDPLNNPAAAAHMAMRAMYHDPLKTRSSGSHRLREGDRGSK
jgi:hypothetical protein